MKRFLSVVIMLCVLAMPLTCSALEEYDYLHVANCDSWVTLRNSPSTSAERLAQSETCDAASENPELCQSLRAALLDCLKEMNARIPQKNPAYRPWQDRGDGKSKGGCAGQRYTRFDCYA